MAEQIKPPTAEDLSRLLKQAEANAPYSEGIAPVTVWTTKDGKRWDSLEDAIAHQRRDKIIDAIFDSENDRALEWMHAQAGKIGDNAAELFAILEPFFRKGE